MKKINHPSIQCAADAVTADEFDIWLGTRLYRVTAYSHADATEAAQEHDRNRNEREREAHEDAQRELLP